MYIRTKRDGEWIHLSALSNKLGVIDITIPSGRANGDVNGDGIIDFKDSTRVLEGVQYETSGGTLGKALAQAEREAADVYEPELGQITHLDAETILSYSVGIKSGYVGKVVSGANWKWVPDYEESPDEDQELGRYVYTIELLGINSDFSIIGLLDYTLEGVFTRFNCKANKIEIVATSIPAEPVHASIIYTSYGANSSIFLMGGMTEAQRESIIDEISNTLPVQTSADGYTDIKNQRQITSITNKRDGQKIEITYVLQGNDPSQTTIADTINLDDRGRPKNGVSNGVEFEIKWEGF